jgi:glycosyltransferase involved in cell wall biosynthesis
MVRTEKRRRIALVTPWYGRELIGGAERLAWELSHAIGRTGALVEVLTTTCRSFHDDWGANYHRPGTSVVDNVIVRRFKVDSRDRAAFARVNGRLLSLPRISLRRDGSPIDERDARVFAEENITSRTLLAFLRERGTNYDAVLFVPYLYGPTLAGVPLVADRAFVIPCLHDEVYAYLDAVRESFAQARGILFNSPGEEEVAGTIFGPAVHAKSSVIGHAVEPAQPPAAPAMVGTFAPHRSRYVLYLGRQDRTKNTDFLLDAFARFREQRVASSLQLVLAGAKPASLREVDGVVALGPVSEEAKALLLTHARALAQPSTNESFSRAIFESWFARRPVVVHGDCRATSRAVEEADGGWIGTSVDDWVRIFTTIDESSDEAIDAIGRHGFAAALENGTWEVVAARTLQAIDEASGRAAAGLAIDQIVPLGEAPVTRYAIALGDALRRTGADVASSIAQSGLVRPQARAIVHASGPDLAPVAPDALIVHTADAALPERMPPVFAANWTALQGLAARGVSARLLPEVVDPGVWSGVRLEQNPFDDGHPTVLSIAPLGVEDAELLIEAFVALVRLAGDARLVIERADCDRAALAALERDRRDLDLHDALVLLDDDRAGRYAARRAAAVACALGRALPDVTRAVDALWFDLPVVAFDDAIVRETIEPCGFVIATRAPREIAVLLKLVATGTAVRRAAITEGRRIRARYAPSTITESLLEALAWQNAPTTTILRPVRQ